MSQLVSSEDDTKTLCLTIDKLAAITFPDICNMFSFDQKEKEKVAKALYQSLTLSEIAIDATVKGFKF